MVVADKDLFLCSNLCLDRSTRIYFFIKIRIKHKNMCFRQGVAIYIPEGESGGRFPSHNYSFMSQGHF